MTLKELHAHWKEYAIKFDDDFGYGIRSLKDIFMICWGEKFGGLLFDTGGEQGSPAYLLKSDDNNNCYSKKDWNAPPNESWIKVGRFIKIVSKKSKTKKQKKQRFSTR